MRSDILFFILTAVIGLITSVEDVRTGKIRNFWIAIGFIYGCILYLASDPGERAPHLFVVSNMALSLLTAYWLWKSKLWFAGDAKLFFLYSILLPAGIYKIAFFPFFPSFQVLFLTFIPAAFYLLILSAVDLFKNWAESSSKLLRGLKIGAPFLFKNTLSFTFIFLLNHILWSRLAPHLPAYEFANRVMFLALFVIYNPLNIFFECHKKIHYAVIVAGLSIALPYFLLDPMRVSKQFFNSLTFCILLIIVSDVYRKITDDHIERSKNKTMPFAPWLFLGMLTTWSLILLYRAPRV
ncbi:MAG TPA: hypothetical protein DCL35_02680 [Candidatus Omnitrophica bacterium]|nr:hypothetical protein [Candidatus Omnitrophota bacterium]